MQNDFLSWKIKKELIPLIIATSIIFSILFLNFLPEFTGFPYWDHDFAYLSSFGMVNSHDARWFGDILGLLTGNDMIPSLALLWSHLFRALGTVCAVYFLCRSEQCFPLVLGALIIDFLLKICLTICTDSRRSFILFPSCSSVLAF